jgi:hypothetical protein
MAANAKFERDENGNRLCECGLVASVKHRNDWKCERCKKIEVEMVNAFVRAPNECDGEKRLTVFPEAGK